MVNERVFVILILSEGRELGVRNIIYILNVSFHIVYLSSKSVVYFVYQY